MNEMGIRKKKKRVNPTFINEHCSRMSIILNMGHTQKPLERTKLMFMF